MEEEPRDQLKFPYAAQADGEKDGVQGAGAKPEDEYPIEVADFGQILKVAFDSLEERLSGPAKQLFVQERGHIRDKAMQLFNETDAEQSPTDRMIGVFALLKESLREENRTLTQKAITDTDERLGREAKAWESIISKLWTELMLSYGKLTNERQSGREKETGTSAPVIPLRSEAQKAE